MQIILTWFEIDRTAYISYLFSLQSLHHRGWPCEITSARSHTCTASVRCMTCFARTQYEKHFYQLFGYYVINFQDLRYYCKYFCRPATPVHGLNRAPLNLITTILNQSTTALPPSPHPRRHQPGQLVYDLNSHPASDS